MAIVFEASCKTASMATNHARSTVVRLPVGNYPAIRIKPVAMCLASVNNTG